MRFESNSTSESLISGSSPGYYAYVQVLGPDQATISVKVSGIPLSYYAPQSGFIGTPAIPADVPITLEVINGGTVLTASAPAPTVYPILSDPDVTALQPFAWRADYANSVSWNETPAGGWTETVYGLPTKPIKITSSTLSFVPNSPAVFVHPANTLSLIPYAAIVGLGKRVEIPGTITSSFLFVGGFAAHHVAVDRPRVLPLPVSSMRFPWQPATISLLPTGNRRLTVDGTLSDGVTVMDVTRDVTWSSSNPAVATISGDGMITAIAAGTAWISATINGVTISIEVRVIAPVPSPTAPLTYSMTQQVDPARSGRATLGGNSLSLPLTGKWTATLNGKVSYPVAAGNKVFVTTSEAPVSHPGGYGTSLYALDVATGNVLWGPVDIPGTYHWSALAYDNGQVFVVNSNAVLRSFNADTGAPGWEIQLRNSSSSEGPPVAVNGVVYVNGHSGGAYAINQADGAELWNVGSSATSPAVTADGVFLSSLCRAYKLNPLDAAVMWSFNSGCSGGNRTTNNFGEGRVYVRDVIAGFENPNEIFDASTGANLGTFTASTMPAIANGRTYYLNNGSLTAVNSSDGVVVWSFGSDPDLITAPLVIDNVVAIGATTGAVYLLDADTGGVLWSGMAAPEMKGPTQYTTGWPPPGLGIGGGYLLVPADNTITGWKLVP